MNILMFTDTHGNTEVYKRFQKLIQQENVEMAICPGDMAMFGSHLEEQLELMNGLGVPVVFVHGNHEPEDEVRKICERLENLHFIHGELTTINGLKFFGFGCDGLRREYPDLLELEEKYKNELDGQTIVVTHAPPHGTAMDQPEPGWHVGSDTLAEFIQRRRPMLVVVGHIHEGFHERDLVAGVPVINPGPDGEIVEVQLD